MNKTLAWLAGGVAALGSAAVLGLVAIVMLPILAFSGVGASPAVAAPAIAGIDPVLLQAYTKAAQSAATIAPGCTGVRWSIIAGIAQIESGQAQGRQVAANGDITPPILGPALDGSGVGGNTTAIYDTDNGRWDGDTLYDRAVGVVQFIPTSWQIYGVDLSADGVANPHNAFDSAGAGVRHLCGTGAKNLGDTRALKDALYAYNHSWDYVEKVHAWIVRFDEMGASAKQVPTGSSGSPIVDAAKAQLGVPYSWGGGNLSGPSLGFCGPAGCQGLSTAGFDCSSLVMYAVYHGKGITIPRTARPQARVGQWIPHTAGTAVLRPGDLVFFGANPGVWDSIHHVGIYVGGGQMIDAPHTGAVVRIEPMWMDEYAGAARI